MDCGYEEDFFAILQELHTHWRINLGDYAEMLHCFRKWANFTLNTDFSTGQAPWYPGRPIGRVQAALAPSLLALDALYNA